MYSWFPMYFPIRDPILLRTGQTLVVEMRRVADADEHRVWYEWQIIEPVVSPVHNKAGRSSYVGR
jgi:protein arginine N-methyltransferase 5